MMLKLSGSVVWGKKGNYNEVTGSPPPMYTFTATETKGDSPPVFPFGL